MDIKVKRGQISIFVIIAIVIICAIFIFLFVFRKSAPFIGQQNFDPQGFMDGCIRTEVRNAVDKIIPQGGFADPRDYKLYNNTRVTYICKNINYYEPCIHQYPRYIDSIQKEISSIIKPGVDGCFASLGQELEKNGYVYSFGQTSIDSVLKPDLVEVNVMQNITVEKNGLSNKFTNFGITVQSPVYNLASVASTIANQEAQFCYFEYLGYSLLYKKYFIKKSTMSDSTKIYSITDLKSGKEMNIAIRGCAVPAGF